MACPWRLEPDIWRRQGDTADRDPESWVHFIFGQRRQGPHHQQLRAVGRADGRASVGQSAQRPFCEAHGPCSAAAAAAVAAAAAACGAAWAGSAEKKRNSRASQRGKHASHVCHRRRCGGGVVFRRFCYAASPTSRAHPAAALHPSATATPSPAEARDRSAATGNSASEAD